MESPLKFSLVYLLIIFSSFVYFVDGQEETENSKSNNRRLTSTLTPITEYIDYLPSLRVYFDPPNGTASPTALGVYVWCSQPTAQIYYTKDISTPMTLNNSYADASMPYIQLTTAAINPTRNQTIGLLAVYTDVKGNLYRSSVVILHYYVESGSRGKSYGFFIPSIESNGYFISLQLEESGAARPQSATTQEFSNFFSNLGIGTYADQVSYLHLPSIDDGLEGFEGGFTYNNSQGQYFGILIPFHNGKVS